MTVKYEPFLVILDIPSIAVTLEVSVLSVPRAGKCQLIVISLLLNQNEQANVAAMRAFLRIELQNRTAVFIVGHECFW